MIIDNISLSDNCEYPVSCFINPCEISDSCDIDVSSECIPNYCGGCHADFYDLNNNLWVTNSQSESPISLFSNDAWQNFSLNTISTNTMIGKILCSTNGQKWIQTRGEGIIVISNNGDQKNLLERKVTSSVNNGSLPSNTINSITEDLDGAIWVGTANGVGVFFFPNSIFSEKQIRLP